MKWESLIGFTLLTLLSCGNLETYKADVITRNFCCGYCSCGGNPIGKTAILVSPDIHRGTLLGGLGFTDTGNKHHRGYPGVLPPCVASL